MRAAVVRELTGPRAATLERIPVPEGGHRFTPDQRLLVEVHAAGIAFPDVLMTRGQLQLEMPVPFVPGAEASGLVVEAYPGSRFRPGDRVAGCILGGALAEYALMRPDYTLRLADDLDFVRGAALPLNYVTAKLALEKARFQPGSDVLILGAAGGVGTASLDLVRLMGGRSLAVVSSDEKAEVALACGAEQALRAGGDWLSEVRAITDGRGVDIVIDLVGGDRFPDHLRSLVIGGRLMVIGFAGGSIPSVAVNRLLLRNLTVAGFDFDEWDVAVPGTARRVYEEVEELARTGSLRPWVGSVLPFEESGEAIATLDERRAIGKVVVEVAGR
jgi:NADPH2:quinone reductase